LGVNCYINFFFASNSTPFLLTQATNDAVILHQSTV